MICSHSCFHISVLHSHFPQFEGLYIFSLLSAANQLRRGKVENVCRSEKETPAVLLEGQRVPRAAGKIEYV